MTGWNMPPGVTGREDHFGPESERVEWRECDATASLLVVPANVDLAAIRHDSEKLAGALRLLYLAEDITCPFAGEVDVAYYSTQATWTCPLCQTDYAEERGT